MYDTKVLEIRPDGVLVETAGPDGAPAQQFLPCDTVVTAFGLKQDAALIEALKDAVPESYVVGDARHVGLIGDATGSAFDACLEIDS